MFLAQQFKRYGITVVKEFVFDNPPTPVGEFVHTHASPTPTPVGEFVKSTFNVTIVTIGEFKFISL